MPEGAIALTEDGAILYCNRRFVSMVDATAKEVMGSTIYEWFAPEDREMLASVIGKVGEEAAKAELRLRRKEGEPLPPYAPW